MLNWKNVQTLTSINSDYSFFIFFSCTFVTDKGTKQHLYKYTKTEKAMEFAATKKNIYNSFDKIIDFFSVTFFGNYVHREEFLHNFRTFLNNNKFPTDKIVIDPFYGYKDEFAIIFKYNEEKVIWIKFKMNEYTKLIKIISTPYTDKNIQKMFQNVIDNFIYNYNSQIFQKQVNKCDINKIIVDDYKDYECNGTQITIKGTLTEMFNIIYNT